MNHRVDHNKEALIEHLQEREWHPKEVESFVRMIGHNALSSYQTALTILEYQQAVDELVQAEKSHDEVFIQPLPEVAPRLEITNISQQFFNRHWKQ